MTNPFKLFTKNKSNIEKIYTNNNSNDISDLNNIATVELHSSEGFLKFTFDSNVFDTLFKQDFLKNTTQSTMNTKKGKSHKFTFNESFSIKSNLGSIYFWKNDYISIKILK
jgi:hypothetical protein